MADDQLQSMIALTQETLGAIISKPPLTARLLKQPPFRYLHDITTELIRSTGTFDGLYTAEEMMSENVQDKASKLAFLQKLIDAVSIAVGQQCPARALKIAAGHEPENTNTLLHMLAQVVHEKCDHRDATRRVLEGEKFADTSSQVKKEKAPKEKDKESRSSSKSEKTEKSSKSKSSKDKEGSRDKAKSSSESKSSSSSSKEAKKSSSSATTKTTTPPDATASSIATATTTKKTSTSSKGHASATSVTSPSSSRKISDSSKTSKPPSGATAGTAASSSSSKKRDKEKGEKKRESKTEKRDKSKTSRRSHAQDTAAVETHKHRGHVIDTSDDDDGGRDQGASTVVRPMSAAGHHRGSEGMPRRHFEESDDDNDADADRAVAAGAGVDDFHGGLPGGVPQGRASTARKRPPKTIRSTGDETSATSSVVQVEKRVGGILGDGAGDGALASDVDDEDDEDNAVVDESKQTAVKAGHDNVHASDEYEAGDVFQGGLVRKLEATAQQLGGRSGGKKGDDDEGLGNKEQTKKEVEKLRGMVQTLCRSANPLAKAMDYVQEDMESMQRELRMWQEENKAHEKRLKEERSATDASLEPLRARVGYLEAQVEQEADKINSLKTDMAKNARTIQQLLQSVIASH